MMNLLKKIILYLMTIIGKTFCQVQNRLCRLQEFTRVSHGSIRPRPWGAAPPASFLNGNSLGARRVPGKEPGEIFWTKSDDIHEVACRVLRR